MRSYVSDRQPVAPASLAVKRLQNRKLLIPPLRVSAAAATGGLNAPMIKTIGKTFYWKQQFEQGRYPTTTRLARTLKFEPGWVAEGLHLTLLARVRQLAQAARLDLRPLGVRQNIAIHPSVNHIRTAL